MKEPKCHGTDLEENPYENCGHYEGQVITRYGDKVYPHGKGVLWTNIRHVRGSNEFVNSEGEHTEYRG